MIISIFISCKKDDLSIGLNSHTTLSQVLSKIMVNNLSTNEYVYNDTNQVIEEKSKYDFTIYDYNSNGQLVTAEYYGNDAILSSDPTISGTAINSSVWVTPQKRYRKR